MIAGCQRVVHA